MNYRRLGRSGLQVSELSLGAWVSFGKQLDAASARECMAVARDGGVNYFDNAEIYARGKAESLMGEAMRELGWSRHKLIVSTKFYWGLSKGPNECNTLNRKYLRHAIDASLTRLQMDYVDLVYCHRPDPFTPIEETVWAMHDMIARGQALYWGTSEWPAADVRAAYDIAERHHLHKPVVEQPQYNLFHRQRVEQDYARLYDDIGLGLATWSPLASGLLTGKYRNGVPPGSRATVEGYEFLRDALLDARRNAQVGELEALAKELGCSVAQLSLAWCLRNPHVSTVITGASRPEQIEHNLRALEVVPRLDASTLARIDAITLSEAE